MQEGDVNEAIRLYEETTNKVAKKVLGYKKKDNDCAFSYEVTKLSKRCRRAYR